MSYDIGRSYRDGVLLRIAVIADTHLEPEGQGPAPRSNRRTRAAMAWVNALEPDLVVHLGDVVHPLPGLAAQDDAFAAADGILRSLDAPLLVTPGNHDLGDKPNPTMPAAAARSGWAAGWRRRGWPLWQAHRLRGVRLLLACGSLFGGGTAEEAAQWAWLDEELAAGAAEGERLLVFTHYPPFILQAMEPGHYDNLDPAPRQRLLALAERHGVEAILSGHAHAFFLNVAERTLLHVVPSIAFARRDYAELSRVPPTTEEEFGRNETGRLGFAVLDMLAEGHALHPVMTDGAEDGPPPAHAFAGFATHPRRRRAPVLGVPLHHPWTEVVALPTNPPTAPFRRRFARDDRTVQLLWRLGLSRLRIPLDDLLEDSARSRVALLAREGFRFWLTTPGVPDADLLALLARDAGLLEGWELVLQEAEIVPAAASLLAAPARALPASRILAPMLTTAARADAPASALFVGAGLPPDATPHAFLGAPSGAFTGWLARIPRALGAGPAIARLAAQAGACGAAASATVCLAPDRSDESWTDDDAIAARVAEAVAAAATHPAVLVWTDTLLDFDRGYFARHGLADRRQRPRRAGLALLSLQAERQGGG